MRIGEKSKITLQPKHGFRKVPKEEFDKYIDIGRISNFEGIYEKMKRNTIIYEIHLLECIQYYDLTGEGRIMKRIISKGEGILKPSSNNEVFFNLKVSKKDKQSILLYAKNNCSLILNEDNFNKNEIIIIKSLKKKEKSIISINSSLLKDGFISNAIKTEINDNLILEIELIKLKDNFYTVSFKDVKYQVKTLTKGLGNIPPYKNSLLNYSLTLLIEDKEIVNDHKSGFLEKLKELKKEIKQNINYEKTLYNNLANFNQKLNFDTRICDPILGNLLEFIIKEIFPKVKIFETLQISFKAKLDYLKLDNFEVINDTEEKNYTFIITLLNFKERHIIFNNTISDDINNKYLLEYKAQANFFFSKGLLNSSKRINSFLVKEFIKKTNLERGINKVSYNKDDSNEVQLAKSLDSLNDSMSIEMQKVFSNLILILYKLKKYKKCEDVIKSYKKIYEKDNEKIIYIEFKINFEIFHNYEVSIELINKLKKINQTNDEYNLVYEKVLKSQKESKIKKNQFVKKMFKCDNKY